LGPFFDSLLVFVDHNAVPLDFFVVAGDVRHVNGNVSVRLLKGGINLVGKLGDIVLDLALGLECGQVHLLDNGLQVFEPVLRFFLVGLHHWCLSMQTLFSSLVCLWLCFCVVR